MKRFLVTPNVSVTLKTARPQIVYVTGAVRASGSLNLKPGWRITEAIGAAGGVALGIETADCTVTLLSKSSGQKNSVRLADVMKGDAIANRVLEPGDVIEVEAVETFPVYVMGKVQRPGLFNIRKDSAGLLEAITMAGGATEDAGLTKVTVTHLDGSTETANIIPVTVEGKQPSPTKLRSGDLIVVPDSMARFVVLGWVNSPGFYPLKENQTVKLSDAIGLARGVDPRRGKMGKVAVLRTVNGKQERMIFDLAKFLKKGDTGQNPQILAGDIVYVPESNRFDLDRILGTVSGATSLIWSVDRFKN
jgi:polysaccharide export outer membrane protein